MKNFKRALSFILASALVTSGAFCAFAADGADSGENFWRGEGFRDPASVERIRMLSYGFDNRQPIDVMLNQGFGGVISNVKFDADYLENDAQFAVLADVFGYAVKNGMKTWIYDEYQWPSGKAFGKVLEGHGELESVGIRHHVLSGKEAGLAEYKVSEKNREIMIMEAYLTVGREEKKLELSGDCKSVSVSADGKWTLDLYILEYPYKGEEDRGDFRTLRPVDILNPAVMERFIDITYKRYKEKLGDAFKDVEAFFTDEPQLGNRGLEDYIVWTDGFDRLFFEKYGYELSLPSLFDGKTKEDKLARVHYYSLVAELFRENYSVALSKWCTENNTAASGHFLFEENMNDHIETYGGDYMQLVGAMDIPGLDVLHTSPSSLLTSATNIGNYMGILYTSSAAKNAGKDRVMVEYNPAAAEKLADETKMGVSYGGLGLLRLLGVTEYTMINPHKSYTNAEYKLLNEYIGRINTVLDGTKGTSSLALFYPIATAQSLHNADMDHSSKSGDKSSAAVQLERNYSALAREMLVRGNMFTIIDDESISSSEVKDGKMKIGLGEYSAIVLAYADYISPAAAEKLSEFAKSGGHVITVGGDPVRATTTSSDDEKIGEYFDKMDEKKEYSKPTEGFYKAVSEYSAGEMKPEGKLSSEKLMLGEFEGDGRRVTYVYSYAKEGEGNSELTLSYRDGEKHAYAVYDPENGEIERFVTNGEGKLTVTLAPNRTLLLVTEDDKYIEETESDTAQSADTSETDEGTSSAGSETASESPESAEITPQTEKSESDTPAESKAPIIIAAVSAIAVLAALAGAVITKKKRRK